MSESSDFVFEYGGQWWIGEDSGDPLTAEGPYETKAEAMVALWEDG